MDDARDVNVFPRNVARGSLLQDLVEPTVRRADQSFLWMTTEQAVGTCINVDDEQLLWKNLQPTPLVKNEVIRIQSQQLGCSSHHIANHARSCISGEVGDGLHLGIHQVSRRGNEHCVALARSHFEPADKVQALCRPSSAVVMHARKHLALKLAQRGKASKAKVPHVDKPIFVSEGDTVAATLNFTGTNAGLGSWSGIKWDVEDDSIVYNSHIHDPAKCVFMM